MGGSIFVNTEGLRSMCGGLLLPCSMAFGFIELALERKRLKHARVKIGRYMILTLAGD